MNRLETPEIALSLREVTIESKCKTCNASPLVSKEWYEGHWGCIECGDPTSNRIENENNNM